MATKPRLRKFILTAHVVTSVGWLGAVGCTLALAVAGLTSDDGEIVRGVYLTLELTGWSVLLPLSVASLVTGLVQSLAGKWGLFRHYWVVVKLVINLSTTVVLLMYMQTLGALADQAARTPAAGDIGGLRSPSPVLHAGVAVLLLLVAAVLSVYKPRGLTPYGWRVSVRDSRAGQRDPGRGRSAGG